MVEINYKIMICGIVCLTVIYMSLLFTNNSNSTIELAIVGTIAMAIGVILPSPKVDNKRGVLTW